MKANVVVGGLAFGILLAAGPAHAQVVQAGVVIRSGPVTGHVLVGEPAPVVVYREPVRRVVVADPYVPRLVVLEPVYVPRGRAYGWWRGYGYRPVVVYYDGRRYYNRWSDGRGLQRIVVYERSGHYYRWDGDAWDHYRERHRGPDHHWRDWDD
jgi:hypothetical protein